MTCNLVVLRPLNTFYENFGLLTKVSHGWADKFCQPCGDIVIQPFTLQTVVLCTLRALHRLQRGGAVERLPDLTWLGVPFRAPPSVRSPPEPNPGSEFDVAF